MSTEFGSLTSKQQISHAAKGQSKLEDPVHISSTSRPQSIQQERITGGTHSNLLLKQQDVKKENIVVINSNSNDALYIREDRPYEEFTDAVFNTSSEAKIVHGG